jgi:aminoglycoside phosphotransferase family enzyme
MSNTLDNYALQKKLIAALRVPSRYPHAVRIVQVFETHISWILLAGRYAYKIKKALDLGFLDYTGLNTRQSCCEAEITLNRRTAEDAPDSKDNSINWNKLKSMLESV